MKITFNRSSGLFLAVIGLLNFTSCSEDFPTNVASDKYTDLKAIRIVNAGANGDEILEGKIDEFAKTISFPRIDTLSDLENIKFEAVTSEGAQLEKEIFEIPYKSGDTQKEIFLKVTNLPRFKEYKATVRFKVPVYGADFALPTVYDYSSNQAGNPTYPSMTGATTRGTGFDGQHVLIVERGGVGPHLLAVEDIKKNNVSNKVLLNQQGVAGGTFAVNMGAQVYGHTYIANLSGPLKLYHWAKPSDAPDLVANIDLATLSGLTNRHGDALSVNIDKNGNGYAYFMSQGNASGGPIIRVKISNFKEGSDVTVITTKTNYNQWGHFSQIGDTDSYILSGHDLPFSLVNSNGSYSYTMKAGTMPKGLSDIKIFTFNGNRYLMGVTVPRGAPNATEGVLYIYDITRGANIVDALTALEQTAVDGKVAPAVYSYTIATASNGNPGTQAGYYITKDESGKDAKLTVYGAVTQHGFAVIDFEVAVAED